MSFLSYYVLVRYFYALDSVQTLQPKTDMENLKEKMKTIISKRLKGRQKICKEIEISA